MEVPLGITFTQPMVISEVAVRVLMISLGVLVSLSGQVDQGLNKFCFKVNGNPLIVPAAH
jgi:hypothetical protein